MEEEAVRSGSAMEMVASVWGRRKWLAILVFALPFVAAMSLIMFMPNIYRSTATVLIERQQVPESMVKPTVTSALETRLHTISQEILSRSRLDALVKRFNLYADLQRRLSPEEVVERMRRDIRLELKSVEQKEDRRRNATISFALSYDGRNPETVAQVTNTLASFYIEENLRVREKQAAGTAEFLQFQRGEVKKRLDEQEARVSEFKKRYMGELPQQTEANLSTIERLSSQLRMNSDNQQRAIERREMLLKQLAEAEQLDEGVAIQSGADGPDGNAQRLARLMEQLRQLSTIYTEKYPDVVRVKSEIAALEREMADSGTRKQDTKPVPVMSPPVMSPYVLRIKEAQASGEGELNVLKGEEQRLRAALSSYIGRVENTPKREQEFRELSRDYDAMREYYASLGKRYDEAQLAESMEQRQKGEQFRVLDAAVPASEPTAPNRLRLFLVALAGCLGLAVAAVFVAEQLNPSFHSVDTLRAFTSVPVLLSIPLIVTADDTARHQRRFRLAAASVTGALVLIVGISFFVAHGNEQLVSLVTRARQQQ
jgi:protein tyrosine kinase modulator